MKKDSEQSTRSQLIEIAIELFLKNGFAATSMSNLADAFGIKKASIYYHFASKEDLFIACVTQGYAGAVSDLTELSEDTSLSELKKMDRAIERLYDATVTSAAGRLSPLIAEVSRTIPKVAHGFFDDYIAVQRQSMKKIISDGVRKEVFKEPDYDVFYHLLFGPMVTLSLSMEMFASFDNIEQHFPYEKLVKGHKKSLFEHLGVYDYV